MTTTINPDTYCAECRCSGATFTGICLRCIARAFAGSAMKSPQGKAVAKRFAEQNRKAARL